MGIKQYDGTGFTDLVPHEWRGGAWHPLSEAWQWHGGQWIPLFHSFTNAGVTLTSRWRRDSGWATVDGWTIDTSYPDTQLSAGTITIPSGSPATINVKFDLSNTSGSYKVDKHVRVVVNGTPIWSVDKGEGDYTVTDTIPYTFSSGDQLWIEGEATGQWTGFGNGMYINTGSYVTIEG